MSVTLTYNLLAFLKRLASVNHLVALMLAAVFLTPATARADNNTFSFSKLAPPISKFKLPSLGDIAIWRNDMQKAKRAYRKGKYQKAQKYFHKALKNKNFIAGWYLGHMHRMGLGVPADAGKAFKFYRSVALEYADHGLPPRIFRIALDSLVRVADGYRVGIKSIGVKRDYRRAMRLYSKAANRGHPAAQYGLAAMYLKGEAVKRNPRKAVRWIRLASRKRFPPALAQLGEFSLQGKYVRKNKVRAVAMYIVATTGTNEALHPQIFDRLDQLARNLTEVEYQQAENIARRWIDKNHLLKPTGLRKLLPLLRRPIELFRPVSQQPVQAAN